MDVSDSHKEIIVCQNYNLMLLNCPTRELIFMISTQPNSCVGLNTLKYFNMIVAMNIRVQTIKNIW